MPESRKIKLAILDMYNNHPNEGMRCLRAFAEQMADTIDHEIFNVRAKNEVPDKGFDLYISSGGPGSPYDGEKQSWETDYFNLVDSIWAHNENTNERKKYFFAICHSFQLLSRHFNLGNVCKRKSTAFGVFPIFKTEVAKLDKFFKGLPDPYFVVDSREWQLIEPDHHKMAGLGANILSLEKKREHVPLPRAVMAMRLSDFFYMTQFHPEADAQGMLRYFAMPEKRELIVKDHGDWKLEEMIRSLSDPQKIPLTHNALVPGFIRSAMTALN